MKYLLKKVLASEFTVLGRFEVGPHKLDLLQKGSEFRALLDGHEVYAAEAIASSHESASIVIGELLSSIFKDEKSNKIKSLRTTDEVKNKINTESFFNRAASKMPEEAIVIDKPIQAKNIKIVTIPDTEFDVELDPELMIRRLLDLKSNIKNLAEVAQDIIDVTQGVTRRKLVDTMWGASSVQKIIDSIKNKIGDPCWNRIDLNVELIDKAILRLISKLRTNLLSTCMEEKKMASEVLIPAVVQNFENLKGLISQLMTCVAPLVNIDEIFKKYTSYPGKFFISDGADEEIQDTFRRLIDFTKSLPHVESSTIIPLDVFRTKILGELKG